MMGGSEIDYCGSSLADEYGTIIAFGAPVVGDAANGLSMAAYVAVGVKSVAEGTAVHSGSQSYFIY